MTHDELIARLGKHEWSDVEFKRAQQGVPDSAYETVSAFANTGGGELVFGIRVKDDSPEVTGVLNVDKVQNDFLSALHAGDKVNHDIEVHPELLEVDGKPVLIFTIAEATRPNKPIYLNGDIRRSYIRRGGGNHRCTKPEIGRFLRDASEERWEGRTLDIPLDEAFDRESLDWYRLQFERVNLGQEEKLGAEDFLHRWGYLLRDEGGLRPTRAAILLFGSPLAMRQLLPRPTLDVQWIPTNLGDPMPEIRWTDRVVFEDNLITTWRGLVLRYMEKAEKPFRIDPHTLMRNDAPPEYRVFREAAINQLIHQDYSTQGLKAVIKFYRDTIQFWNPGDAFCDSDALLKPGEKEVRNPQVAAAFRRLGLCEQAGTGMNMMLEQWQALDHPEPELENDRKSKAFEMRLPLVARSASSSPLSSPPSSPLSSPPNSEIDREKRAVQADYQQSPQSTSPQVERLLQAILGEMRRDALQQAIGLKSVRNFRELYLEPALKAELIEMTIPDKPKSKDQAYRITKRGRQVLKSMRISESKRRYGNGK